MKVVVLHRLQRAERMMVRWMCGVTLKDRKSTDELRQCLGIKDVGDIVRRGRLKLFGHVERKDEEDWFSKCRYLEIDGARGRGRGKKTWSECVGNDFKLFGLKREEAQDKDGWRRGIL